MMLSPKLGASELYVSLDDGFKNHVVEMFLHFLNDLVAKRNLESYMVKQSFDIELGIVYFLYAFDGVEQFAQTFKRIIFALYRNHDRIGCSQSAFKVSKPSDGAQSIKI
jgi:hypothetical protein